MVDDRPPSRVRRSSPSSPRATRGGGYGSGPPTAPEVARAELPGAPPAPAAAASIFGARLGLAARYADLLATDGVQRGILGPREVPRLWDRHLLNCAVVAELIPPDAHVIDVGSGGGLPGLVLALARPDLEVTLLEPLARRAAFLNEVVTQLDQPGVTVVRGRAEEWQRSPDVRVGDVATARAVAPLDRLARWCLPLVAVGGRLLSIKGQSAGAELAAAAGAVRAAGGVRPAVHTCGVGVVDPPTTVIEIVRGSASTRRRSR